MKNNLAIWSRRFFMIVIPLMLTALEWNHPSGFSKDVFGGLHHMSAWWMYLHIIQSFLIGGIILGVYFLTAWIPGIWSLLSKIFLFFFGITYLVFDSTAGIGVGFILKTYQQTSNLDEGTIRVLTQKLYNDPVIGGTGSLFSLTGSWSWLLSIACAIVAIYLYKSSAPRKILLPPLILLAISAYSLFVGHFWPYGPIAFISFALAAIWIDYFNICKV